MIKNMSVFMIMIGIGIFCSIRVIVLLFKILKCMKEQKVEVFVDRGFLGGLFIMIFFLISYVLCLIFDYRVILYQGMEKIYVYAYVIPMLHLGIEMMMKQSLIMFDKDRFILFFKENIQLRYISIKKEKNILGRKYVWIQSQNNTKLLIMHKEVYHKFIKKLEDVK